MGKRWKWAGGAAALLVGTPVGAQQAPLPVEIVAPGGVREPDALQRSTVSFPGNVRARTDIAYANPIGFRPLTLDIYTKDGARNRPLLIYVHGGSWLAGNPREAAVYKDWPGILAAMAARGYAVASVSYRLSGEARFPTAVQDVKAAIQYLRANADRFGIDPARVGIWGDSAGGHLVGMVGTTCGVPAFDPVAEPPRRPSAQPGPPAPPPPSNCVQAVVGWYGVYDLLDEGPVERPPAPPEDPVRRFLGCAAAQCSEEQKRQASPITYVDATDAPMLLIHGSDDFAVPARQSEVMAERLRSVGVPAEVKIIDGANHGWFAKTPEAMLAAGREAMRLTIDYFDARLKP